MTCGYVIATCHVTCGYEPACTRTRTRTHALHARAHSHLIAARRAEKAEEASAKKAEEEETAEAESKSEEVNSVLSSPRTSSDSSPRFTAVPATLARLLCSSLPPLSPQPQTVIISTDVLNLQVEAEEGDGGEEVLKDAVEVETRGETEQAEEEEADAEQRRVEQRLFQDMQRPNAAQQEQGAKAKFAPSEEANEATEEPRRGEQRLIQHVLSITKNPNQSWESYRDHMSLHAASKHA